MRYLPAFLLLLSLGACREAAMTTVPAPVVIAPPAQPAVDTTPAQADLDALDRFLSRSASPRQSVRVRSDTTTIVCGRAGLRVRVEPQHLECADGSPVTGPIDVTLVELQRQGDFIRNDIPTTSGGRLLESGGSYFIGMRCGSKELRLKPGKDLDVVMPRFAAKDMELFYGRKVAGSIDWVPAGQDIRPLEDNREFDYAGSGYPVRMDSLEVRVRVPQYRDSILVDMEVAPGQRRRSVNLDAFRHYSRVGLKLINNHLYYVCGIEDTTRSVYETRCLSQAQRVAGQFYEWMAFNRLGWINCDRFVNTNTYVLRGRLPAGTELIRGHAFLIYRDINSVDRTPIQFSEERAVFIGNVPGNQPFKLVAFAWKGGRPFLFTQRLNVTGATELTMDFRPVREEELAEQLEI